MTWRRAAGFTLIEVMVAMTIFALLSAMAYTGLRTVADAREQLEAQAERLKTIQQTFIVIERDFQQVIPRGIRDGFGDSRAAMISDDLASLEFTRAGRSNPLGMTRSEFERVGYRIDDKELLRMSWGVLDQQVEPPLAETALIEGVDDLLFRYMDDDGQWREVWPPAGQGRDSLAIPRAVELTLNLEDLGPIVRVFRLPDGPEQGPVP